jgi:hypothetical protein
MRHAGMMALILPLPKVPLYKPLQQEKSFLVVGALRVMDE